LQFARFDDGPVGNFTGLNSDAKIEGHFVRLSNFDDQQKKSEKKVKEKIIKITVGS
jgi:Fe-S-cluster formation regulator IscX/YfhJ